MVHRNLPRSRQKRNAAPVSRVTWKEKNIMSNAIPETGRIWKDLTWNVKVPEKDNFWTRITSNMIVPEKEKIGKTNHIKCESSWKGKLLKRNRIKYDGSWKGQIWKYFITSNVKVPELEHFWKEITSYMIVLAKGKKFLRYATWPDSYSHTLQFLGFIVLTFLNCRFLTFFISCFAAWDMSCRYVDMSICRCDSMWWQPLFGISGAWSAFFSPQSSRRSAMDTERNSATWTPEFIIVHHTSSRIQ